MEDKQKINKAPEMTDQGKVLNVADVEVNTMMSTEDLVSGGDI